MPLHPLLACSLLVFAVFPTFAQDSATQTTVTSALSALEAYEEGFAFGVRRNPRGPGVALQDWVLIENDGPGAGRSEKGIWREPLNRGIQAKKILRVPNPSARSAQAVIYLEPQGSKESPYHLLVNGHRIEGIPIPWHERRWHWVQVPVEYLKAGDNEIVAVCDAPEGEGYNLLIAREDEYEGGGGKFTYRGNTALISAGQVEVPGTEALAGTGFEPIEVGDSSFKSTDGGKNWDQGVLGATAEVVGEYTIRLNLEQFGTQGFLRSPVIDLWAGVPGAGEILPKCEVLSASLLPRAEEPAGTRLAWKVRWGDSLDPESTSWTPYRMVGTGSPSAPLPLEPAGHRFLQWEAELLSRDPLESPTVLGATVERVLRYTPLPRERYYVRSSENPEHRYSTYHFHYEDYSRPELKALAQRLGLEELLAGAAGDFEKINRLRHHVSTQWHHGNPFPRYPEWDAHEILDRRDELGYGGMCIQFSLVFIQSLLSQGYQARHLNIFSHETVEVYIDELGRWVHVDPESVFDSYEYSTLTGEPLNVLEQHGHFLDLYGFSAENPIDWMSPEPWCNWPSNDVRFNPQPLEISTFTGWINDPDPNRRPPQHRLAGFFRMMPRNDYFSRPWPRPLTQGAIHWPWNGYLNWYDEATPRKLQYALHSDRAADFYPTLNRVEWTATAGQSEGEIEMDLIAFAPNFDTFEINRNGEGWKPAQAHFTWNLRRSGVNRLEMRTRNQAGVAGYPSHLEVFWHYREPFKEKDW
jgi:hypothetical protein